MGKNKKVKCKQCNKELFYLPSNYAMSFDVICIECEDGKKKSISKKIQTASSRFAQTRKGKREDLGNDTFRSATEANFARILTKLNIEYKFEQRTFFFHDYKVKPHQYTPDFEIIKGNEQFPAGWYEIKGYMDGPSRTKLKRLYKNYPEEAAKMIIVLYRKGDKKAIEFCNKQGYRYMFYDELTKQFAFDIPKWEK
jgi:hypothetical protein